MDADGCNVYIGMYVMDGCTSMDVVCILVCIDGWIGIDVMDL